MTLLKKGYPCRVRLHTGEVVEAVYECGAGGKDHYARLNGKRILVWHHKHGKPSPAKGAKYQCVNFATNPCDLAPVGVSV